MRYRMASGIQHSNVADFTVSHNQFEVYIDRDWLKECGLIVVFR